MKALAFTADATTVAPATLPTQDTAPSGETSGFVDVSTDEATEVLRDDVEDEDADGEAAVRDEFGAGDEAVAAADAAAPSAEELLLRLPPTIEDEEREFRVGSLTMRSSAGFAAFLMKPESESMIHF